MEYCEKAGLHFAYKLFTFVLGLNELVPDNLLTMFSEQELEVSIRLICI